MIEIRNLYGTLGEFHLKDIQLTVRDREYLVLLGPTGAGKTVLIEYIAGIYRQDSGTIMINGTDMTPLYMEDRNIAYVPQDYALFPNMTVEKNIAYGLEARKIHRSEIQSIVNRMVSKLGIDHIRNRMPLHLSGGEKQRVALGRALAIKPDVVLLDEPLSALDENLRTALARDLRKLQQDLNATFIHVCHNFEEASDVADRIAIMNDGRLIQTGTLAEIKTAPQNRFVATFLKSVNIFEAEIDGTFVTCNGQKFQKSSSLSGKAVLTVRPENIVLSANGPADKKANTFSGKIRSITSKPHLVEYTVDIGIALTAFRIEPLSAGINDTVSVHVPSEHLVLLQEDDQ